MTRHVEAHLTGAGWFRVTVTDIHDAGVCVVRSACGRRVAQVMRQLGGAA